MKTTKLRTPAPSVLALAAVLALGLAPACGGGDKGSAGNTSGGRPAGTRPADADGDQGGEGGEEAAEAEPEPSGLTAEERLDPANAGSIRGRVRFEGDPPERTVISGPSSTPGCKHHPTPPLSERAIVNEGMLQNVFVYVRKSGLPRGFEVPPAPEEPARLDQLGCIYVPHVQGMRVGQKLLITNSDELAHNVNCRSTRNQAINPTQPMGGAAIEWVPERREVMTRFECNIHNWMWAYVGVLEHPYFAVSAADGSFAIGGLPPGRYELEAWHEKFDKQKMRVTVPKQGAADVEVTFR